MSYSVRLGSEYSANITSNVAKMWRLAGCDLAEYHMMSADALAAALGPAIADMRANPAKYQALNPANGWGSYETCLRFLTDLHDACIKHDLTTVRIDR